MIVPAGPAQVPTPLPHPFSGGLEGGLASSVRIGGKAAAVVGSTADNSPPHLPTPPGTTFQSPPSNEATIKMGSATVRSRARRAARMGDTPNLQRSGRPAVGTVMGTATVQIGG